MYVTSGVCLAHSFTGVYNFCLSLFFSLCLPYPPMFFYFPYYTSVNYAGQVQYLPAGESFQKNLRRGEVVSAHRLLYVILLCPVKLGGEKGTLWISEKESSRATQE